jgi:hypothetical protein
MRGEDTAEPPSGGNGGAHRFCGPGGRRIWRYGCDTFCC